MVAHYPLTVHLGPHDIFVAFAGRVHHGVPVADVAAVVVRVEERIRAAAPDVQPIFIEAASLRCSPPSPDAVSR